MPEAKTDIVPLEYLLPDDWKPPLCLSFSDIPDTGLVAAVHAEGDHLIAGHPERWNQTFIKLNLMGLAHLVPLLVPVSLDFLPSDSIEDREKKTEMRKQFWGAVVATLLPVTAVGGAD